MEAGIPSSRIVTRQVIQSLCDWPTNTFSVDYSCTNKPKQQQQNDDEEVELPHTVLVFVPGNPGLIEWYIPFFEQILRRLGRGFAVRGVALAGHGTTPDLNDVAQLASNGDQRSTCIPWTVDGQSLHKIAYIDTITSEFQKIQQEQQQKCAQSQCAKITKQQEDGRKSSSNHPENPVQFIFVSHSIGAHFVQRMLMLRMDILQRTRQLLYLTPYMRMKAPLDKQLLLNFGSANPNRIISFAQFLMKHFQKRFATDEEFRKYLQQRGVFQEDDEGCLVAANLLRQPHFAKNFFQLGLEEVRDVPEHFDTCALRMIGRFCPIDMLFAGNDHWSPKEHINDLRSLKNRKAIPASTITVTYRPDIKHDFVSEPISNVPVVVDFCVERIRKKQQKNIRCKL